jgi:hypothetical protein
MRPIGVTESAREKAKAWRGRLQRSDTAEEPSTGDVLAAFRNLPFVGTEIEFHREGGAGIGRALTRCVVEADTGDGLERG